MKAISTTNRRQFAIATILLAATSGCQSLRPHLAEPAGEPVRMLNGQTTPAIPATGEWWQVYRDNTLNRLVERALRANRDIAVAVARIDQAQADRQVIASQRGPQISSGGAVQRVDIGDQVPILSLAPGNHRLTTVGASAGWELDFFGRVKREIAAAKADIAATSATADGVKLMVAAGVCSSYFKLRAERDLADLTRQTELSQHETFRVAKAKVTAGTGTEADMARAETAWRSVAAQTPLHEAAIEHHRAQLALWCGTVTENLSPAELSAASHATAKAPTLPTSIDSALLRRRPDIRQAEHQLAAAQARVEVAVREFYPKIKLTGIGGWNGINAGNLLTSGNALWAVGPSIEWPIFQSGRLKAGVAARSAEQRQAVAHYESVVLAALAEIHSGMAKARAEQKRLEQLSAAHTAARRATELTNSSYRNGATPITDLLETERNAFATRSATIESRLALLIAHLQLSKASGGEFR